MSTAVPKLRDEILLKAARLVERTRILELNRADSAHLERGGEIFFVLDTNAIQAFLQPFHRPGLIRLFHNKMWSPHGPETKIDYEALSDSVGAQATLLATEIMLGSPAGAGAKRTFMSLPHIEELSGQAERLLDGVRQIDARTDLKHTMREILAVADLQSIGLDEALKRIAKDELFVSPLLLASTKDRRELERIRGDYIVSTICRILAEDRLLEPMEQLERLGRGDLEGRLSPIEWQFEAFGEDERQIVEYEKIWLGRLRREHARRKPSDSRYHSLAADARTMAYIIWIARHRLGVNQRIAFVTGDRLLLDAYRRWYMDSDDVGSFLLRPLAQFGPQYNLHDAKAAVAGARALFERWRATVGGSTLPIVLELLNHYKKQVTGPPYHVSARVRDKFCIDVIDDNVAEDLVDVLTKSALPYHRTHLSMRIDELDRMAEDLRAIERLTIGVLPNLVQKRVQKAIERSAELAEALATKTDEGAQGDIAAHWFNERFDRAMDHAFTFALPIAAELIRYWDQPLGTVRRTPATLRLLFPLNTKGMTAEDWLSDSKDNRLEALKELRAYSPALVFALASWLTYRSKLWGDAIRFADLAAQAAKTSTSLPAEAFVDSEGTTIDSAAIRRECLYLKALALRMRMASERPTPDYDTDVWRGDLERAEEALEMSGGLGSDDLPATAYLRARSERAAVRLTYCAWAAVGDLGSLGPYRSDPLALGGIIGGAIEDLDTVAKELPAVRKQVARRDRGRDTREDVLGWVELQTSSNQECARLLCDLLLQAALEPGLTVSSDASNAHQIFTAYKLSADRRRVSEISESEAARNLSAQISQLDLGLEELALDRAMVNAIKQRWLRSPGDFTQS